jgi:DNA-binding transcriptional LysR family regulator
MSTGIELRHLRAFVAVAEELHFTRAAARLHLAQQALSTQIRQLEDELGTPLFHRTTRRVELTDAGRTLLLHAGPILASVSAAFQQTQRAGSGELGTLSIAYTPTVAEETLPPLIAAVHDRLPDVRVRTCEMWQA